MKITKDSRKEKNSTGFMPEDNGILHQPLFWITRWVRISWPVGMYIIKINYMLTTVYLNLISFYKKALFRCWPIEHILLNIAKMHKSMMLCCFVTVLYKYWHLDSLKSKFKILNTSSLDFCKGQFLLTFDTVLVHTFLISSHVYIPFSTLQ